MRQSQGLYDLHSHILPKVDDGAKNMDETKKLIDMAYEQGIRYIMATPHYIKGENSYTMQQLVERFEEVKELVAQWHPDLSIYLGNEIFYSASVVEDLKDGKIQTLNGGNYILVEFSTRVSYREIQQAMRNLILARYTPIIAHMERYECLFKQKDRLNELRRMGVYFQMNVGSLIGGFFDSHVRECRKLVLDGYIQFLGTDMHSSRHCPPRMGEAMEWMNKKVPDELRKKLLYENPIRVLNNEV